MLGIKDILRISPKLKTFDMLKKHKYLQTLKNTNLLQVSV